jgi:hypothetical protein
LVERIGAAQRELEKTHITVRDYQPRQLVPVSIAQRTKAVWDEGGAADDDE